MAESIEQWSLPSDTKKILSDRFKELHNKVVLEVFTKKGQNDQYSALTVFFVKELEKISEKIEVHVNTVGDEQSKKYHVSRAPTVLISPEEYHLRYTGAPLGQEGQSFIEAIVLVSQKASSLSKISKELLAELQEPRHLQVFVTLTCPYCPLQVLTAFKAAIQNPKYISSECVELSENLDLAKKYDIVSVPQTLINEKKIGRGLEPEEQLIAEAVSLQPITELAEELKGNREDITVDLIIVGGGPAGLTAGIYAARSGLKAIVLEKDVVGGQVTITPLVENWPGFQRIPGKQLMDMITAQAQNYVSILEGEEVQEIKVGKNIEALTRRNHFIGKALILATGVTPKKLNIPGEETFFGRGVSYCATCDGYLFKGKQAIVVGGGNTALTDTLYLNNLGVKVTILNNKAMFSADQVLQESLQKEHIPVLWDTLIQEVKGTKNVSEVRVKNLKTGNMNTLKTEAVFVAIGGVSNSRLASEIGVKLDDSGYIEVDRYGRTNIPRIYGAGDVTGGVRQIVTAVGSGAAAATSAFEDIIRPSGAGQKK
jgi:thioredoxin reductase (NADPH)